ncbi:hypothetical protein DH2020_029271 [Rehmannia glutinosa]|uniref:Homeobox domain-containing protein n=1 Tax=Rehmannia glutinosa TaxID=99300 RepID=A0ABR0VP12_REHGL
MVESQIEEVGLGLGLGLGLNEFKPKKRDNYPQKNKRLFFLDLSIPLNQPSDHGITSDDSSSSLKIMGKDVKQGNNKNIGFSNGSKEDDDDCKFSMDFSSRKKLRLTRDQTTLLEDSFKHQTTLNTAQKQALAEKLNLKPRQVEVWFQNRRARKHRTATL